MNTVVSSDYSKAFDVAADTYDSFELLPGSYRLRAIIHSAMGRYFHPGQRILELNCGTGTDAVRLAHRGVKVHATDGSAAMLCIAEGKLHREGVAAFVTTQRVNLESLHKVTGVPYDGIFSNLGGLNCIPDLATVSRPLASLVRPGGFVILVVMPTFSPWESMSFLARGDIRNAFRRRKPAIANLNGIGVRTFYHSVASIVNAFNGEFIHVRTLGLNILTPPPTSVAAYRRLGRTLQLLEMLENVCAPLYPFNRLGDHVLIVLQRRENQKGTF